MDIVGDTANTTALVVFLTDDALKILSQSCLTHALDQEWFPAMFNASQVSAAETSSDDEEARALR